ncbi:hypothetical protein ID866_748 [Astraeus odoratus]|nr:hypothetical protein ID866_748 [Astraeus odoratus]
MFRQSARIQLRRYLHTQARNTRPLGRYFHPAYVLGASVTIATYCAWTWNSSSRLISLDSELGTKEQRMSTSTSVHPSPLSEKTSSTSSPSDARASKPKSRSSDAAQPDTASSDAPVQGENEPESAEGGGAFNPETGEINWDCPCLGGMAHGPCGPEFREAFSCFVYSDKEPKGIDCVEKFKAMQDCFRAHPDVYGDEIMDDDEESTEAAQEAPAQPKSEGPSPEAKEQRPAPISQAS